MAFIKVRELIQQYPRLGLNLLTGEQGLNRHITNVDLNRPGLALAGYYKNYASDRLQVFGRGESAYLQDINPEQKKEMLKHFFEFEYPALVFTHNHVPSDDFLSMADAVQVPILNTAQTTHNFIVYYTHVLNEVLAPTTSIHGVLIDVFGVGILLMGASGIGKSETALELVERGHRLVADDAVQIRCIGDTELQGTASEVIAHHMELRGLGIINVKDLFGVGAIRPRSRIDLLIRLEDWDVGREYDRLGIQEETAEILNVSIPRLVLPIRPGRNVPVLIETAAMNHRSKRMGYHAARELSERINIEIEKKRQHQNDNTL